MATKHEFELGDKVIYTHILKREWGKFGGHWVAHELPEPQKGVIVGARGKENSLEHGRFERFKVFMIGQQLFRGAKPVLPIHITKLYTQTIDIHHFDPAEPNIDTIHTLGTSDNGGTWQVIKEKKVVRNLVLDELTEQAQNDGDYD